MPLSDEERGRYEFCVGLGSIGDVYSADLHGCMSHHRTAPMRRMAAEIARRRLAEDDAERAKGADTSPLANAPLYPMTPEELKANPGDPAKNVADWRAFLGIPEHIAKAPPEHVTATEMGLMTPRGTPERADDGSEVRTVTGTTNTPAWELKSVTVGGVEWLARRKDAPLAVGDVVRLASGGPRMTLEEIDGDLAHLVRFEGDKHVRVDIALACLRRAPEEPTP